MRKVVKIAVWIIASILLLVITAALCLNSQWGQSFVRGKAEKFLAGKLKTEVRIGYLGVGFPKFIVIKNVLFKDQAKDTLLSADELKIDINMIALLRKNVDVQHIVLAGVYSHIYRNQQDTDYNFTYILQAFTSSKPKVEAKPKDTTSKPLNIDLGKVSLSNIRLRFDDFAGGMRLAVNLDRLDLGMKKLDLDKMSFHVKNLSVAGLQTEFSQDTSYLPLRPHKPGNADVQLVADNVDLNNVKFKYADKVSQLMFALNVGELNLQLNKFGLATSEVDVKKLTIGNTDMTLLFGRKMKPPISADSNIKKDNTSSWNIVAREVIFNGVNFKMDDESVQKLPKGIDYAHLNLSGIMLNLKHAKYNPDSLSGELQNLAVTEQSGVQVKEMRTEFRYNNRGAILNKLYLETSKSVIQDHLEVHYPSIDSLKSRLSSLQLNVDLQKSKVAVSDVLLFVPELEKQKMFKENKNGQLIIETKFAGFLNDLKISRFYAAGLNNTVVLLNGWVKGLPKPDEISYALNIVKLESSARDLSTFVPDSVLAAIRVPDKFLISGPVSGTIRDYTTNINITTTDGLAYVRGTLAMSPGKGHEKYDLVLSTAQLNIGHILRRDSLMGPASVRFVVKGTGLDPQLMNAVVDGNIVSAMVNGYRYHGIELFGKVAGKKGDLDLQSADANAHVQLKGHADFSGKYPAVEADIRVDSIDLQALKLYKTEFRASGTIHADFPELNPDYPRGKLISWQPIVTTNGKRYYLDSLYVISRPSADSGQNIRADLGVLTASITGKMPLTKVGTVIQEHINRHYALATNDSINKKELQLAAQPKSDVLLKKSPSLPLKASVPLDYDLHISANIMDKPMLRSILPGLTSFDSIHVGATITPRILNVDITAPDVVYSGTTVENAVVKVRGTDSAFTYQITAGKISQSKFALWLADIHGSVSQHTITTAINVSDESGKKRFALGATMESRGDSQVLHLGPGLKLDYNDWSVDPANRIVLGNGGFYARNFEIGYSGQTIRANSAESRMGAPLKIDIGNFSLSNLTRTVSSGDTLLAGGVLGGIVNIDQFQPTLKVKSDVEILDLSILGDTLGNLQLQVNNLRDNVLDTKAKLNGHNNDIALSGAYYQKATDGNDFKLNVDVNALAVRSFETIAQSQIRNSSGYLRGKLAIEGTISAPQITGELRTDNLITTVSQLNATFKMPAEKIEFTKGHISFSKFAIRDNADNVATVDGSINYTSISDMEMDLKLRATKWQALHSSVNDNKVFYGDVVLTTNLSIKGNPMGPMIDGDLKILKGTKFTFVNPESNIGVESRKGIVAFVNMKDTGKRNILAPRTQKQTKGKAAAGAEFNVNITIDKAAEFSLIIDKASGDFLSVKGDANLNVAMRPNGTVALTGSYALTDGAYLLNYNFVKRKFKIADGSTITFAGDPVKGTMLDITAVYEAQVAPYDLVQREIADPAQLNFFKQRLPFNVDLAMHGPILTPKLTFDIKLAEGKMYKLTEDQIDLVQGKLSQVRTDISELNKQVFAILILNRFVSDDPFKSGASSSLSFTALQSVSTFIGEQLNAAAGKLVKGVDFSVDLATTEDYTTGDLRQRTDLNLAASKQLLNDRLKLTLGNNFELDGPQTNTGTQSGYVPSNLAADYLLSADGKYTMRAYRRAYDEGVLQGFVTETGLNFILSFDYNKIKRAIKPRKNKPDSTRY